MKKITLRAPDEVLDKIKETEEKIAENKKSREGYEFCGQDGMVHCIDNITSSLKTELRLLKWFINK